MKRLFTLLAVAAAAIPAAASAAPAVAITEWMYQGAGGEFVEFTNLSTSPVNFAGWSYDDDSRLPGTFSLSGFGTVASGESVVITESTEAAFRTTWGLGAGVKVLGGYTNNLGRADEINLYDAGNALVDRLAYGDTTFPGTIRTQEISGRPVSAAALGANDPALWVLSTVGDIERSYAASGGAIGSPGFTSFATAGSTPGTPVPEPGTTALLLAGLGLLTAVTLRRNSVS